MEALMPASRTSKRRTGGRPFEAVVIGGGIAGCTLAYELATRDVKVALLEQSAIASESSGRNTGTLLTGPQKEVVELLDGCAEIYAEIARGPIPFEFARIGHLLISEDDASYAAAAVVAERYRQVGVGMEAVSGRDLARDHPRLGLKIAGGYFVERAWTLEPMGATHAFAQAARAASASSPTRDSSRRTWSSSPMGCGWQTSFAALSATGRFPACPSPPGAAGSSNSASSISRCPGSSRS